MKSSVIVIGASGGIGSGVVATLLADGYPVVAVGRHRDTLLQLADKLGRPSALTVLTASVESDTAARDLVQQLVGLRRRYAGAVVSIGPERECGRLMDRDDVFLEDRLHAHVVTHFNAARALIPMLAQGAPNALYLGIASAATAHPWCGFGHFSIANAALRMLARVVHAESRDLPVRVQQLALAGLVRTYRNDHCACSEWMEVDAVGQAVIELLQHSDGSAAVLDLRAGGSPEPVHV
jgi:NAD(P)-dependent dehydrogenase (short-subunit alcohol dehydrogenase family)